MSTQDAATLALSAAIGLLGGWVLGGPVLGVALMVAGAGYGALANRYRVRGVIAVAVLAGTLVGALIGARVTHVLCLPGSCAGLEISAALVAGIGAFVGVGLVAALVTRSFDEYRESVTRPLPTPDRPTSDRDSDENGSADS